MSAFKGFYAGLRHQFRSPLRIAALCAAGVSAAAVALLGVSGWFLSAAALAGAAGGAVLIAFNYLLPSAAIRGLAIARTVLRYFERYQGHAAALRALALLRPWVFERLSRAEPQRVLGLSRGDASARLVQDVGVLEGALVARSAWASGAGGILAAGLLALFLGPWAVVIALGGVSIMGGIGVWAMRQAHEATAQTAMGALKQRFFETLPFLPDMAAYDLSGRFLADLSEREAAFKAARAVQNRREGYLPALSFAVMAVTLLVMVLVHRAAPVPMLALSLLVTTAAFESVGALLRVYGQSVAFDEAETRAAEIADMPEAALAGEAKAFSYEGVDYGLGPETRLLIDGASGSGKTRLIEAIMGLRADAPGLEVAVGAGVFALSAQDAPVLNGTVYENLLMAGISDEAAMWAALEAAQLKARVEAMRGGLKAWVGEGGITLSGGERKRLSLARALLRDAPVLVLDEPTEGLDAGTEAAVIAAVEAHLTARGQGLVLISHRAGPRRLCRDVLEVK